MKDGLRVLVLGGYGNFGRLIVRRLRSIEGLGVIAAGRDLAKARALAVETGCEAARLDIDQPGLAQAFVELGAQVVISTVGPFQGQDYRVPRRRWRRAAITSTWPMRGPSSAASADWTPLPASAACWSVLAPARFRG